MQNASRDGPTLSHAAATNAPLFHTHTHTQPRLPAVAAVAKDTPAKPVPAKPRAEEVRKRAEREEGESEENWRGAEKKKEHSPDDWPPPARLGVAPLGRAACRASLSQPHPTPHPTPPRARALPPNPQPQAEASSESAWAEALRLQATGEVVNTTITGVNRGGATVAVAGLRAFAPLSRLDPARLPGDGSGRLPPAMVGAGIKVKVLQVNAAGKQLIVSERAACVADLASSVAPGDVLAGVVTRLADYGAFVSLQSPDGGLHGAEGLIHISELSWDAVLTPEAVVQPGTVVRAVVLAADAARGRIELSLKRLEADPLTQTLDALLPIGGDGGAGAATAAGAPSSGAPASSSSPSSSVLEKTAHLPAHIPAPIEGVCSALRAEPGVTSLRVGRQVEEKRAVSQDLELWISREVVADGYTLVARSGRLVQEIHVTTDMAPDEIRGAVTRVLSRLV